MGQIGRARRVPTYTAHRLAPACLARYPHETSERLTTRGGARHNLSARKKLIKPFCISPGEYKFTGSAPISPRSAIMLTLVAHPSTHICGVSVCVCVSRGVSRKILIHMYLRCIIHFTNVLTLNHLRSPPLSLSLSLFPFGIAVLRGA